MNKTIKKIWILLGVFVAAVAVYFVWEQKTTEKEETTVYTSLEEASLPVVYTDMFGREMNVLHGYRQDMGQTTARENLTVLPEDRALRIHITGSRDVITGIGYEIRSLDLERLVERTSLTVWEAGENGTYAVLPIQNLLSRNTEYLLTLTLDTENHGAISYYTRVMWSDNENLQSMVEFALDFTTRTFDYDQARELVTYLETDNTEDNSSLGSVSIRSSFSQLTWAGLEMKPLGDMHVTLKELDGIMCNVEVNYMVSRDSASGAEELYEVVDNYTMKWDPRRIYLMGFKRKTDQVFSGHRDLFAGKRVLLGITNDGEVSSLKSPGGSHIAFVVNRDLWNYDQVEKRAVKIFSFRSGKDDGSQSGYDQHGIKILAAADNGDMDFLVYGYMNRGIHEGGMGIALYHYSFEEDTIQERFFIPVTASFEEIGFEVEQLAHLGTNGMLYLMVNHAVFGIDLNSNEYMVLADALREGNYAVSDSERHFAWQEGGSLYDSHLIHLMDLDTGDKREIRGAEGDLMRTLGFVGDDFIYGMARKGDIWVVNGRVLDLPMYALEIRGADSGIEKRYEHEGSYIADVEVEEGRVHLNQVARLSDQEYSRVRQDTIVCNQSTGVDPMAGVGWYASEERRKLYFIQLDHEVKNNRSIEVSTPKKVAYDTSEMLSLKANNEVEDREFYAYGGGRLLGTTRLFSDAVAMAYEEMGIVTDRNQRILWDRVNREPVKNIKDPVMAAGKLTHNISEFAGNDVYGEELLILDARGCSLSQILYFIDKNCPVVAFTGEGSYVLLCGYDQYNVSIYNSETQNTVKIGFNDATEYFKRFGNDFLCGLFIE